VHRLSAGLAALFCDGSLQLRDPVLEALAAEQASGEVAKLLVQNPRTPLQISMKLINRMSVRDLRDLSRDKNIADAVRSTALRLYRIKQQ